MYLDFSLEKENELVSSVADYSALCIEKGKIDHTMCYAEMKKYFDVNNTTEGISEVSNSESTEEESSEVIESTVDDAQEVNDLKEKIRNTEVGESLFLGETEQDNDLNNGSEPIEWIVLEKTESEVFVISKKIIEYLTFSKYDNWVGVDGVMFMAPQNFFTWRIDRNQQRVWLNDNLYEHGFTESEKAIIKLTHNKTPGYKDNYDLQESDDFLYIPSKEEVEQYIPDVTQRQAEMTEYVAEKAEKKEEEYGTWSLRTEGATPKYSMQILENGEFSSMYCSVTNGVRPVMWLDIS